MWVLHLPVPLVRYERPLAPLVLACFETLRSSVHAQEWEVIGLVEGKHKALAAQSS
jgi:hypothetical protein